MKDFFKFMTRLDNLVLLACLILMGAVVCYGENGPTPQVIVGSTNISDSSVTTAKIADDAVTAEKILETIDLPINSISATSALNSSGTMAIDGFSRLGESSIGIKFKPLTGTTPSSGPNTALLWHGLDSSKIITISGLVYYSAANSIPPNHISASGYEWFADVGGNEIGVHVTAANSGNVLDKPVIILVWYRE